MAALSSSEDCPRRIGVVSRTAGLATVGSGAATVPLARRRPDHPGLPAQALAHPPDHGL